MSSIREHLPEHTSFDPEAIRTLTKAFIDACAALQVLAADKEGREIIAARIIDLARGGLLNARALRNRIVREARSVAKEIASP
jgi:hypothetical protein